jgi:hypothetical protein
MKVTKSSKLDKDHEMTLILNVVARKVEVERSNHGGVARYGAIAKIIKEMKPRNPWLTKRKVMYHLNKIKLQSEAIAAESNHLIPPRASYIHSPNLRFLSPFPSRAQHSEAFEH